MSKLIRMPVVEEMTGYTSSTIYLAIREGTFPKPVKIGQRASAWVESEVNAWINARINERDFAA